jgi:hypothetical protein
MDSLWLISSSCSDSSEAFSRLRLRNICPNTWDDNQNAVHQLSPFLEFPDPEDVENGVRGPRRF